MTPTDDEHGKSQAICKNRQTEPGKAADSAGLGSSRKQTRQREARHRTGLPPEDTPGRKHAPAEGGTPPKRPLDVFVENEYLYRQCQNH